MSTARAFHCPQSVADEIEKQNKPWQRAIFRLGPMRIYWSRTKGAWIWNGQETDVCALGHCEATQVRRRSVIDRSQWPGNSMTTGVNAAFPSLR